MERMGFTMDILGAAAVAVRGLPKSSKNWISIAKELSSILVLPMMNQNELKEQEI